MSDLLDRTADWPAPLVLVAAALLLAAESGTLVGLFLPGVSTLVALGLWSSASGTPVGLVAGVAAGATVTGAVTGYLRGRQPRPTRLLRGRALATARRARGWLAEHGRPGAWLLLPAGHWVSGVRTLLPRLAAASGVPPWVAVPTLVVSGTAWAGTVVSVSRAFGPQIVSHAERLAAVVLVVLLVVVLVRQVRTRPHE